MNGLKFPFNISYKGIKYYFLKTGLASFTHLVSFEPISFAWNAKYNSFEGEHLLEISFMVMYSLGSLPKAKYIITMQDGYSKSSKTCRREHLDVE